MNYQKRQRDYPFLGTSVVFHAFWSPRMMEFFGIVPNPMYVLLQDGLLFHYHAEEDVRARAAAWMRKYGTLEALREQKEDHDRRARRYRSFLEEDHADATAALEALHAFLADLLPVVMVAIEVPECLDRNHNSTLFDACMDIRRENEDLFKIGFSLEAHLLGRLEAEREIPAGTLPLLTLREFRVFLETGILPEQLECRKRFYLVKHVYGEETAFADPSALADCGLVGDTEEAEAEEVRGKTAHPGFARGPVRIVWKVEDAGRVQEGDILVAPMTDPRCLPAIRKAAAIVTDEGGITCHAAIVARELGKPCVIGTKIATRTFKDGDVVEVDAVNGIVRRVV